MKKIHFCNIFFFTLLSLFSLNVFAWNHSVDIGYGFSHDPNHTKYNNSAVLLSGDLIPLRRTPWTFWSINGSVGHLHTTAPINKNVTSAALSLALRFYTFEFKNNHTYLLGTVGPSYISQPRLGQNTQASHGTIQTTLGLGNEYKHLDMNLRLLHYSNAGFGHVNQGFNVLYLLSLGYLF